MNGLRERVASACGQIRRYAARGPGLHESLFTFSFEIDALCALKRYRKAWNQLQLRDQIRFGKRSDLTRRDWSADDCWELVVSYAPLLFFLRKHRDGCSLLETSLDFRFVGQKVQSYDLLFQVYKGDQEPGDRYQVTLFHFYQRLGKSLREWHHWEAFVAGLHPRLFRLTGVGREELLGDPQHLAPFFHRLMETRAERTTSGVTRGQADLIESPGKVRKWQEATQERRRQFVERTEARREQTQATLHRLFPELARVPT